MIFKMPGLYRGKWALRFSRERAQHRVGYSLYSLNSTNFIWAHLKWKLLMGRLVSSLDETHSVWYPGKGDREKTTPRFNMHCTRWRELYSAEFISGSPLYVIRSNILNGYLVGPWLRVEPSCIRREEDFLVGITSVSHCTQLYKRI